MESTRFDGRAGRLAAVDVDVFLSWVQTVDAELRAGEPVLAADGDYQPVDVTLSAFYYGRMRDEFQPALDAWLDTHPLRDPQAPETPFQMAEYVLADARAAADLRAEASEHTDAALRASQNSDDHVLTAVALALGIFFAGVGSKVEAVRRRQVTVAISIVVLVGAAVVLVALPKLSPF